MPRLHVAALAALLLIAGAARAQGESKASTPPAAPATPSLAPTPPAPAQGTAAQPAAGEVDQKTKEAIQKAIEKAKDDIRNEVRAEIQGAQSAAEFMGAVAEGPKLEFFQLDGYFRVRGQLFDNLSLRRTADASGHFLFPIPLQNSVVQQEDLSFKPAHRGTVSSANMRLRLEPTLNVSEHVRVKSQIDVLDNYVLGSSNNQIYSDANPNYPAPFYGSSRRLSLNDPTADRATIQPKRVWGEIQTPVGLLSFGRMPSEWGLGMLTKAGSGIDDDYGDTIDRIQFALPPVATPIGSLTFVPILDFDGEGVLNADPHQGLGVGQPFDADSSDDARTYAIKIARLDTEDEIRRKLERNEASFNFGTYYNYRTQRDYYPTWATNGFAGTYANPVPVTETNPSPAHHRGAYAHIFDGWFRLLRGRLRVEAEGAGIIGQIGNAFTPVMFTDVNGNVVPTSVGRVLLRQWGAVLQMDYQTIPNKLTLGGELGIASGDSAPGFGNVPDRVVDPTYIPGAATAGDLPPYGSVEGIQYGQPGDNAIRNFRFNPAYRVDLVLWREILGQVTDAWYVKPKVRWDILPGLRFDGAAIYSQAMDGGSTPSAVASPTNPLVLQKPGKKPLGIEFDGKLSLEGGDGFVAWGEVGVLQPLGGLGPGSLSRGWVLSFGFAAKY